MSKDKKREYDEYRRYTRLKEQNRKLRKEVAKLRRENEKLRNSSQDRLKDRAEQKEENGRVTLQCSICGNEDIDSLEMSRPDGKFVIDICNSCGHRSKLRGVRDD